MNAMQHIGHRACCRCCQISVNDVESILPLIEVKPECHRCCLSAAVNERVAVVQDDANGAVTDGRQPSLQDRQAASGFDLKVPGAKSQTGHAARMLLVQAIVLTFKDLHYFVPKPQAITILSRVRALCHC